MAEVIAEKVSLATVDGLLIDVIALTLDLIGNACRTDRQLGLSMRELGSIKRTNSPALFRPVF